MARFRGSRWRLLHPPTHLYYFNRKTMGDLLGRSGIEEVHFEHCGFYRSLRQMLYSTLLLGRKAAWKLQCERLLRRLLDASVYLNLYDIMLVIGRKA
jgi:hypothetical protein